VLFDPQTSGGLLVSVSAERAEDMSESLKGRGVEVAAIVGEVIPEPKERIIVV
jgi:selenide,water dikinase